MVNDYYDLVTDFYEYGWGQSFHFAPRHKGESFEASLVRHELYLAARCGSGERHQTFLADAEVRSVRSEDQHAAGAGREQVARLVHFHAVGQAFAAGRKRRDVQKNPAPGQRPVV